MHGDVDGGVVDGCAIVLRKFSFGLRVCIGRFGAGDRYGFLAGRVARDFGRGRGSLLMKWFGARIFAYIFCRGFAFTLAIALCCSLASQAGVLGLRAPVDFEVLFVAIWLNAWDEAMVTGMLVASMVAYAPSWLSTWSDRLYLAKPAGLLKKMKNPPPWYSDRPPGK